RFGEAGPDLCRGGREGEEEARGSSDEDLGDRVLEVAREDTLGRRLRRDRRRSRRDSDPGRNREERLELGLECPHSRQKVRRGYQVPGSGEEQKGCYRLDMDVQEMIRLAEVLMEDWHMYDEAATVLRWARELFPEEEDAARLLVEALSKSGEEEEARKLSNELGPRDDPEDLMTHAIAQAA